MSEFYNFDGSFIRLAGTSPTEFFATSLTLQAPGKKSAFTYEIDRAVAGELPFVTLDERFEEAAVDEAGFWSPVLSSQPDDEPLQYEARLGQIDWRGGELSTTVLSIEATSGITTLRYVFALDGDPLPILRSTSALEYNAFIQSITGIGPASGAFGPGETINLKRLELARNEDPGGKVESGRFGQDNVLVGTFGADRLEGANGKDKITGFASGDTLIGGDGRDVLKGGDGDDTLIADTVLGDTDRDRMFGGAGDDFFQAGGGKDLLVGGAGADTFAFADGDGVSIVKDFDPSRRGETIDLSDVTAIRSFRDLSNNHVSEKKGNVIIEDGETLRIVLKDIGLDQLDSGDFAF